MGTVRKSSKNREKQNITTIMHNSSTRLAETCIPLLNKSLKMFLTSNNCFWLKYKSIHHKITSIHNFFQWTRQIRSETDQVQFTSEKSQWTEDNRGWTFTPCLHRTRVPLRDVTKNTIDPIIISDAVYTGCGVTRQIPDSKLLPPSI